MRPMRHMMLAAALLALSARATHATVVVGPPPTPEALVAQTIGIWDRARAQHDQRYLANLAAEDFIALTATGEQLDRAALLARGTPERGARMVSSEIVSVHVTGDTARASARVTSIQSERGVVTLERITLRREPDLRGGGERWRIVRSESSPYEGASSN
jgi:ketosteroid isomerase-like protein